MDLILLGMVVVAFLLMGTRDNFVKMWLRRCNECNKHVWHQVPRQLCRPCFDKRYPWLAKYTKVRVRVPQEKG